MTVLRMLPILLACWVAVLAARPTRVEQTSPG